MSHQSNRSAIGSVRLILPTISDPDLSTDLCWKSYWGLDTGVEQHTNTCEVHLKAENFFFYTLRHYRRWPWMNESVTCGVMGTRAVGFDEKHEERGIVVEELGTRPCRVRNSFSFTFLWGVASADLCTFTTSMNVLGGLPVFLLPVSSNITCPLYPLSLPGKCANLKTRLVSN